MNKKVLLAVIAIIILAIAGYMLTPALPSPNSSKIKIAATFYPHAEFARNVGKEQVEVQNITPAGTEPHDYEPTPQDIATVYTAKLFISNGSGVDSWVDKIKAELESKGVVVLRVSDNIKALENDPHFWLNPLLVQKEIDLIAAALIKVDSEHAAIYVQNRDAYKAQLAALDQEYKTGLANCKLREIITSHNAFNYLAKQYGFNTIYILGLSPQDDPSPKTMAEVVKVAKEKKIKHVFFETLVSPKLSESIANEIGAQTLELNPIEGLTDAEIAQGKNYISIMRSNLNNLRIALECQ